jgi:hypothetical protein
MLLSLALFFLRAAMRRIDHQDDQHANFPLLEKAERLIRFARS